MSRRTGRLCWCGGAEARRLFRVRLPDGFERWWVRCARCGVYAMHPQPAAEELLPYYAADYYGASPRKFVGPVARLVEFFQDGRARLVAPRIPAGGRILDVGCGNGGFLQRMARRGFQCEGTEWTEQSARRIAPEPRLAVHVGDLLSLDLPASTYDAVTLWHVFEHLAQPAETLKRLYGLLKPGGWLFLSMPNHEGVQARRFGPHWFHLDPPRHLHGFGPQSLGELLQEKGFGVVCWHTWSLEQNPYGYIQSVLNRWGFPRDRAYAALKGTAHEGGAVRLLDLALVVGLTIPGVVLSSLESMVRQGATMTIAARKPG